MYCWRVVTDVGVGDAHAIEDGFPGDLDFAVLE